jgi:hypothetical protein
MLGASVVAALGIACTGSISDLAFDAAKQPVGPSGVIGQPSDPNRVAPMPLRRLTHAEYDATVRDLFGLGDTAAARFPADDNAVGFSNAVVIQNVSPDLALLYANSAAALAAGSVTDVVAAAGCEPALEEECARRAVASFGARAYRRPLAEGELDRLVALFAANRPARTFEHAMRIVITAMLQSPHFLYRPELPSGPVAGDAIALGPYEVAARLSYLYAGSMPDDELWRLAETGELLAPGEVERQAERLLTSERGRALARQFVLEWFDLDRIDRVAKSDVAYPEFSPALRDAMANDATRFVDWVLWDSDARLHTLLTSPMVFADAALGNVYGLDAAPADDQTPTSAPAEERAGLLTRAGFLAVFANPQQTDPVRRGLFVREQLLCQSLPEPPSTLMPIEPEPSTGTTTRERYQQHATDPMCSGCHRWMDPIGFGFEGYDAIGRYRTEENGVPVDDTGEIIDATGVEGTFEGAVELAEQLAGSAEVSDCAVRQWFRWAFGRLEADDDLATLAAMRDAFMRADGDLRALLLSVASTRAFTHGRTP